MARVELLSEAEAPLLARDFYARGDPGPITASMAQVPELLDVAMPFLGAALGPSSIPLRPKELVILRTSGVMRCTYCVAAHTPVALDAGLDHDQVAALRDEKPLAEAFDDPRELALLHWVDAVATGTGKVDDAVADEMKAHWPEHEMVELTVLVGATMLLNRYCSSLELPNSPDTVARLRQEGFS